MTFEDLKFPKLLYKSTSDYNERIEVYQVGQTRRLSVNNVVQSISANAPSVNNRVWGKVVELVKEHRPNAKDILMFGLGGGTMAHLFEQELPEARLTIVEIDKVMVEVAKKFFEIDTIPNLSVITADALRVVSEPEKFNLVKDSFDVVIVDIYCGEEYPDLGKHGTFFNGIKWFLRPGGLVVFNRIYMEHHQSEVDIFADILGEVFNEVGTSTVAGRSNSDNILIYGEV